MEAVILFILKHLGAEKNVWVIQKNAVWTQVLALFDLYRLCETNMNPTDINPIKIKF